MTVEQRAAEAERTRRLTDGMLEWLGSAEVPYGLEHRKQEDVPVCGRCGRWTPAGRGESLVLCTSCHPGGES